MLKSTITVADAKKNSDLVMNVSIRIIVHRVPNGMEVPAWRTMTKSMVIDVIKKKYFFCKNYSNCLAGYCKKSNIFLWK